MRHDKSLPTLETALKMDTAEMVEFQGSQYSTSIYGWISPAGVREIEKEFTRLVVKEFEKSPLVRALRG